MKMLEQEYKWLAGADASQGTSQEFKDSRSILQRVSLRRCSNARASGRGSGANLVNLGQHREE